MSTFETRIQDEAEYPMTRLERTAANLNAALVEAKTTDLATAQFYTGRLALVRAEIARRVIASAPLPYAEASAEAGAMDVPVMLAVLDAAGWTVFETERDDTLALRGMVTCALYQYQRDKEATR
jgi:hypothetical protein